MILTKARVQRIEKGGTFRVMYLRTDPRLELEEWTEKLADAFLFDSYEDGEKVAKLVRQGSYPIVLSNDRAPIFWDVNQRLDEGKQRGAGVRTGSLHHDRERETLASMPALDPRRTHYGYDD